MQQIAHETLVLIDNHSVALLGLAYLGVVIHFARIAFLAVIQSSR